jgi:lysozyme
MAVAAENVNQLATVPLTQNQFDALCDFVFNVGAGNFEESTLLRKLNDGDYGGAASEFDRWVHSGQTVLPGLVRRRAAEKALFLKDRI